MADVSHPPAELLRDMGELANGAEVASWWVWEASQAEHLLPPPGEGDPCRDAHRAGFVSGMAYLAGLTDAVLERLDALPAAPGGPGEEPELGFVPGRFAGSSGRLEARGEAIDKG